MIKWSKLLEISGKENPTNCISHDYHGRRIKFTGSTFTNYYSNAFFIYSPNQRLAKTSSGSTPTLYLAPRQISDERHQTEEGTKASLLFSIFHNQNRAPQYMIRPAPPHPSPTPVPGHTFRRPSQPPRRRALAPSSTNTEDWCGNA